MSEEPSFTLDTGDAYTNAVLELCFKTLYTVDRLREFVDYVHFYRYFCWAFDYLQYDTKRNRDGVFVSKTPRAWSVIERRRWSERLLYKTWLFGHDLHQTTPVEVTDEQLARILYAAYIKPRTAHCVNEAFVLMDVFTPKRAGEPPFCRADARNLGRNCKNMNSWKPVVRGGGDDGGGGLGSKWEDQLALMDKYAEELGAKTLETLLDTLRVPTAAPIAGGAGRAAVAIAVPRGGRRGRRGYYSQV